MAGGKGRPHRTRPAAIARFPAATGFGSGCHELRIGPTHAARAGSYQLVLLAACAHVRSPPEHEPPISAQNVYETPRDKSSFWARFHDLFGDRPFSGSSPSASARYISASFRYRRLSRSDLQEWSGERTLPPCPDKPAAFVTSRQRSAYSLSQATCRCRYCSGLSPFEAELLAQNTGLRS
jgi:hypothetical protein